MPFETRGNDIAGTEAAGMKAGAAKNFFDEVRPISYRKGKIFLLDQTALPEEERIVEVGAAEECRDAIRRLTVRGAPAIGIAAAFGMAVASENCGETTFDGYLAHMKKARECLASSRPTAVNLFWALDRMEKKILDSRGLPLGEIRKAVEREALAIQREEEEVCRAIGVHGQEIVR
ncbi:MAG: hypothetical protein LBL51_00450, partial [Synergistaceae bacterium]|nr:hypothetical protein [Synergistaceae bacterium]